MICQSQNVSCCASLAGFVQKNSTWDQRLKQSRDKDKIDYELHSGTQFANFALIHRARTLQGSLSEKQERTKKSRNEIKFDCAPDKILLRRFIGGGRALEKVIQQLNHILEGVSEDAAHVAQHIHARPPAHLRQRHQLKPAPGRVRFEL